MIALAALLFLQAGLPTVGDTVWITVRVPLGARQIVRPQTWEVGSVGQALGPPVVELEPDSATIRYPVAFWFPGEHRLVVPGPIVVNPEGRSDTLATRPVLVTVRSVLPAGSRRDTLPPEPEAPVLDQAERSLLPVVVLELLVAGIAAGTAAILRRRWRPRPVPPLPPAPVEPIEGVLDRWSGVGETRTALDGWAHLIGAKAAGEDEAVRLLATIDAIGFRDDAPAEEVEAVVARARGFLRGRAG